MIEEVELIRPEAILWMAASADITTTRISSPSAANPCIPSALLESTLPQNRWIRSLEVPGVDSGLPDFRGDAGFWKAYPLLKEEGVNFHDLANPVWFKNDPTRAWGFYGHRLKMYQATNPHSGFEVLKKWCTSKDSEPFVFTSNVDGHFQKMGFTEQQVFECHGSINYLQCSDVCRNEIWPVSELDIVVDQETLRATGSLPRCKFCNATARPNILMFGDYSWIADRSARQNDRFRVWLSEHAEKNIITIEIGAGEAIPTVRIASESMSGALVRINPRDSHGPQGTISLPLDAHGALELLDKLV